MKVSNVVLVSDLNDIHSVSEPASCIPLLLKLRRMGANSISNLFKESRLLVRQFLVFLLSCAERLVKSFVIQSGE